MPKLSIRDLDLTDKRVLIRVDFNVPLKDGIITDDTRIRETLPTIEYALRHKAKVILCSHLGRPKGKPVASMSLRPIVDHLRNLLDHLLGDDENVAFSPDCIGEVASEMAANLESGNLSCSKISASTPKRRPTIRPLPPNSPASATSTSTMPSAALTAPMPPPRASPASSSNPLPAC